MTPLIISVEICRSKPKLLIPHKSRLVKSYQVTFKKCVKSHTLNPDLSFGTSILRQLEPFESQISVLRWLQLVGLVTCRCLMLAFLYFVVPRPITSHLVTWLDAGRSSQKCDIFGKYQRRSNDFQVAILAKNPQSPAKPSPEKKKKSKFWSYWQCAILEGIGVNSHLMLSSRLFLLHSQHSEVERR